jgi:hypothetical protein
MGWRRLGYWLDGGGGGGGGLVNTYDVLMVGLSMARVIVLIFEVEF